MKWTQEQVLDIAKSLGLDPFPTDFHVVPSEVLYDVAARGIPGRYSHWSHGKDFYGGITRHNYKMSRIYELVINSNPSQAYLLDVNSDIINIMVIAHVYGHTDFFKHNRAFKNTNRDMPDMSVLRSERMKEYEGKYGEEQVRDMIDSALTLQFYVDEDGYNPTTKQENNERIVGIYDDILNVDRKHECNNCADCDCKKDKSPGLPCNDVLAFLITEAPLEDWEKDILSIVRQDGLYFWPQIKTKISNEGWASFWHNKIMHKLDLTDGEFVEYAEVNSGVVSSHVASLNPYWLGLQIFKDIEKRLGIEKLFEVRRLETDSSFLRNYLTKDLVEKLGLIRYGEKYDKYIVTETEWENVRDGIINDLTSRFPAIQVVNKDYDNRGVLLLKHNYDGRKLKKVSAVKVLQHIEKLWKKPVYLITNIKNENDITLWKSR